MANKFLMSIRLSQYIDMPCLNMTLHTCVSVCVLFSWLSEPRPRCGPKKRWRDVVRKDLDYIGVNEDKWYEEATRSRANVSQWCRSSSR